MKIISWNTRGIMGQSKQLAIKTLLKKVNPEIVLIQETKREEIDSYIIRHYGVQKELVGYLLKLVVDPRFADYVE